ncbi:Hypothetical predicted protein, partial [Paramuricea clavata]
MLAPMNSNLYTNHVSDVTAIHGAAEVVAKASMKVQLRRQSSFMNQKKMVCMILVIGITADGTRRRRGYSSSYGVVTDMSLITGKVLDGEVMSKECWECITWSSKKGSEEFEHWWE